MNGHSTNILYNIFRDFNSAWKHLLGLWQQFREYSIKDTGVGSISLAGGEEIGRVAVANHAGKEEGAARLHCKTNTSERESEFGFHTRDTVHL